MIKVVIIVAFAVVVQCQEHSYSHKTVIKHEAPKKVVTQHHIQPIHSHGQAVSSQNAAHHESSKHAGQSHSHTEPSYYFVPAKPAPVHEAAVQNVVPVHHAPVQHDTQHQSHHEDYYAYPKYSFEYKVEDPHTGDKKFQHESRDGDVVKGVYWLHEADGSVRTVKYSSDKHSGFNAIVHNSEPSKHIEPQSHYHH